MDDLSPRQQEILEFIRSVIDQRGVPPSYREIGGALGIGSTNAVSDHIKALVRKGFIERVGGRGAPRSIRLTVQASDTFEDEGVQGIPILGRIAAGQPLLAQENYEGTLRVDSSMVPRGGNIFALVVTGDSMIDDGIHDGDYLFVREKKTARNGEIAVVMVEGEATVKRFFQDGQTVRLEPANSAMKPILIDRRAGDVQVVGVAVGLFRKI
jgi:repressor LexA